MIRSFVYGTLKRGQSNHHLLKNEANGKSLYIGKAMTVEQWPLVVGSRYNIPYILDCPGKGHFVFGEVYDIDDDMLARLDELERHPVYYKRTDIQVKLIEDSNLKALEKQPPITCRFYVLPNYKDHMLSLPFLQEYKDCDHFRYYKRMDRDCETEDHRVDVMHI